MSGWSPAGKVVLVTGGAAGIAAWRRDEPPEGAPYLGSWSWKDADGGAAA